MIDQKENKNGFLHNLSKKFPQNQLSLLFNFGNSMSEENGNDKKTCIKKKKVMIAYGFIQLSSNVISTLALATIALGFCSVKKEANMFTNCVQDMQSNGLSYASAVRYCNGGK